MKYNAYLRGIKAAHHDRNLQMVTDCPYQQQKLINWWFAGYMDYNQGYVDETGHPVIH